jgi:hypothetical protein
MDIKAILTVGILSPVMISGILLVFKGNQIFSMLKRRMSGKFLEKAMEGTRFGKTE